MTLSKILSKILFVVGLVYSQPEIEKRVEIKQYTDEQKKGIRDYISTSGAPKYPAHSEDTIRIRNEGLKKIFQDFDLSCQCEEDECVSEYDEYSERRVYRGSRYRVGALHRMIKSIATDYIRISETRPSCCFNGIEEEDGDWFKSINDALHCARYVRYEGSEDCVRSSIIKCILNYAFYSYFKDKNTDQINSGLKVYFFNTELSHDYIYRSEEKKLFDLPSRVLSSREYEDCDASYIGEYISRKTINEKESAEEITVVYDYSYNHFTNSKFLHTYTDEDSKRHVVLVPVKLKYMSMYQEQPYEERNPDGYLGKYIDGEENIHLLYADNDYIDSDEKKHIVFNGTNTHGYEEKHPEGFISQYIDEQGNTHLIYSCDIETYKDDIVRFHRDAEGILHLYYSVVTNTEDEEYKEEYEGKFLRQFTDHSLSYKVTEFEDKNGEKCNSKYFT